MKGVGLMSRIGMIFSMWLRVYDGSENELILLDVDEFIIIWDNLEVDEIMMWH